MGCHPESDLCFLVSSLGIVFQEAVSSEAFFADSDSGCFSSLISLVVAAEDCCDRHRPAQASASSFLALALAVVVVSAAAVVSVVSSVTDLALSFW